MEDYEALGIFKFMAIRKYKLGSAKKNGFKFILDYPNNTTLIICNLFPFYTHLNSLLDGLYFWQVDPRDRAWELGMKKLLISKDISLWSPRQWWHEVPTISRKALRWEASLQYLAETQYSCILSPIEEIMKFYH